MIAARQGWGEGATGVIRDSSRKRSKPPGATDVMQRRHYFDDISCESSEETAAFSALRGQSTPNYAACDVHCTPLIALDEGHLPS